MPAISINTVAVTGGQVNAVNSNGVTWSNVGSGLSLSAQATQVTLSQWPLLHPGMMSTSTTTNGYTALAGPGWVSVHPIVFPAPMSINQVQWGFLIRAQGGAVGNSGANSKYHGLAIYSLTSNTLTRLASMMLGWSYSVTGILTGTFGSWEGTNSFTTNATSFPDFCNGTRFQSATGINTTFPAGQYWLAWFMASSRVGGGFTIDRATAAECHMGFGPATAALSMVGATSTVPYYKVFGTYSLNSTVVSTSPESHFPASFDKSILSTHSIQSSVSPPFVYLRCS